MPICAWRKRASQACGHTAQPNAAQAPCPVRRRISFAAALFQLRREFARCPALQGACVCVRVCACVRTCVHTRAR
eukprot:7824360-Alexandrium_andersonii.AAC.1